MHTKEKKKFVPLVCIFFALPVPLVSVVCLLHLAAIAGRRLSLLAPLKKRGSNFSIHLGQSIFAPNAFAQHHGHQAHFFTERPPLRKSELISLLKSIQPGE